MAEATSEGQRGVVAGMEATGPAAVEEGRRMVDDPQMREGL